MAGTAQGKSVTASSDTLPSEVITKITQSIASMSGLYVERSQAYSSLGQHNEALEDAVLALEANHSDPKAHRRHGDALFELGRFKAASTAYHQARVLATTNHEAYLAAKGFFSTILAHGTLLRRKGHKGIKTAIDVYSTGIEFTAAFGNRGWLCGMYEKKGRCYLDLRLEWSKALYNFNQAIATAGLGNPDLHLYHEGRSAALLELGRYQEALDSAEKAIEAKPVWAPAYRKKALALDALASEAELSAARTHNKIVIGRLPPDIWAMIWEFCPVEDIKAIGQTNQEWQHLRFRHVYQSLSFAKQDLKGMDETDYRKLMQVLWQDTAGRYQREVHHITLTKVTPSRVLTRSGVSELEKFLLIFPNVEEVIVDVDHESLEYAAKVFQAMEWKSAGTRWPRLSEGHVWWWSTGRCDLRRTVFDRWAPQGCVPIETNDMDVQAAADLAKCAQSLLSVVAASTQGSHHQRYLFEGDPSSSNVALLATEFVAAGLSAELTIVKEAEVEASEDGESDEHSDGGSAVESVLEAAAAPAAEASMVAEQETAQEAVQVVV